MKRTAGFLLIALGVFFLALAPMLRFYALPRLQQAPLNQYTVSVSEATGATVFDPATLSETQTDLVATRIVKGDVSGALSAPDSGTAVYDESLVLERADGVLADASTNRIAFDANTSQIINCCGNSINGVAVEMSGLFPYKFPFGTQQQTYDYFDVILQATAPMEFVGEDERNGVSVYQFEQTIEPTQIGTQNVPGSLVGAPDDSYAAPRFYGNVRTVWVEPTTGVIVDGQEVQLQTLRGPDGTDQVTLISATLAFTDTTIAEAAKLAKDGTAQLRLIGTIVPIVALLLGAVLLAVGIVLMRRSTPRGDAAAVGDTAPVLSGSA